MSQVDLERWKQHISQEIHRLLEATGQNCPPFDPEPLAPFRRVTDIRREKLHTHGMLIPVKDGFVIKLNSDTPRTRQRSTCAHEIAHTFFYDLSASPPRRMDYGTGRYGYEENMCNELTGEILMPEEVTRQTLAQFDYPSIRAFATLMSQFDVSSEFLAWRLHMLKTWRVIVVFFAPRGSYSRYGRSQLEEEAFRLPQDSAAKPLEAQPLQVWKVFKHADYRRIRIRLGLFIDERLSPTIAFRTGTEVILQEYWELGGLKGNFLAQSRRFEGRPRHVVSILLLNDEYKNIAFGNIEQRSQLSLL